MRKIVFPSRSLLFPLISTMSSWILLGCLVYFVNPEILKPVWYVPFWILIWIASTWTVSLVLKRLMRGMLYGTGAIVFLLLRFFGMGTIVNGLLLFGLIFFIDWYVLHIEKRIVS